MSKVYPSKFSCRARPPAVEFFSKTVTSYPACARHVAAERPEKPAPMMEIFFKGGKIKINHRGAETMGVLFNGIIITAEMQRRG